MSVYFELYARIAIGGALGFGGVLLLMYAKEFGQTRGLFRHINLDPKRRWFTLPSGTRDPVEGQPVLAGHGPLVGALVPTLRQRLFRAAEERDLVTQPALTTYGRAVGLFTILCSVCTFLPGVPITAPYAAFYIGLGSISLAAFMRSKARSPKRIAALDVRSMRSSLPTYQVVGGALAALTPLVLWPDPD